MISTNNFKTGVTIQHEGNLYTVMEFQHVKPGKGPAFVRSKLRNLRTGGILDKTWRAGEKLATAHIDKDKMNYSYNMGDTYIFMDNENFEQLNVPNSSVGDGKNYLIAGVNVDLLFDGSEVLDVRLPSHITLEVTATEPGFKGNTATGASKPATLETGYVLNVPLFINEGDKIKVETAKGTYKERIKA